MAKETKDYLALPRHRRYLDKNVWELAHERVHRMYDLFDHVYVSFSGGKDSSATLEVVRNVARERDAGPVNVFFFDEEVLPWQTVEYMQRLDAEPDIDLQWLCLPFECRNACSYTSPHWYPWAPEMKHLWARPMPDTPSLVSELEGVTDVAREDRPAIIHAVWRLIKPEHTGTVGQALGIRADESPARTRSMTMKVEDNWITNIPKTHEPHGWDPTGRIKKCSPIFDWSDQDVWRCVRGHDRDYNKAYDHYDMFGYTAAQARVSPAFGEEPILSLHAYAECFPEVFQKLVHRVPGADAAWRYASTELYARGGRAPRPAGWTWKQHFEYLIGKHPPDIQKYITVSLKKKIGSHVKRAGGDPILPTVDHPDSGVSWKGLTRIAQKGDVKGRDIAFSDDSAAHRQKWNDEYQKIVAMGRLRIDTEWDPT